MKVLVACVVLACVAVSSATPWAICDYGLGLADVTSVEISGCDNSADYCEFTSNTNVDVTITFTAHSTPATLKIELGFGFEDGQTFDFAPIPNDDACSLLDCPLIEGQSYTFSSSMFIDPKYPVGAFIALWELNGGTGEEVEDDLCFTIFGNIV